MYGSIRIGKGWFDLMTSPEGAKQRVARELLEVVMRSIFVENDAEGWKGHNALNFSPFTLRGTRYDGLSLSYPVDVDTVEYLKYDYNGLKLYVLKPSNPLSDPVYLAAKRTSGGSTDHIVLDLSRSSEDFLLTVLTHIVELAPASYRTAYVNIRDAATREAGEASRETR